MNILFLTNALEVGGIETNLVRLTRELTGRGHKVTIGAGSGILDGAVRDAGGEFYEIPFARAAAWLDLFHCKEFGLGQSLEFVRPVQHLTALMSDGSFDIVHVFSPLTSAVALASALLLRVRGKQRPPIVSTIMGLHDAPSDWAGKIYLRAWLTAMGSDRLLVISPAIDRIVQRLPISREKVRRIPVVGIDVRGRARVTESGSAALRLTLGISPEERLIMTMGALSPRKSHELFIEAAGILAARVPNARFLIVGDGPLRSRLQEQIDCLGLGGGRIVLLGQRRDVLELIGASDVYVKPGIVEGFVGITVLEAQLVGRPVVAFDTLDVRMAIDHGVTGILVERGSSVMLAAAIGELLESPAIARRICSAAQKRVCEHFAIGPVVSGLLKEYAVLLG